jgi:hypothetical protein
MRYRWSHHATKEKTENISANNEEAMSQKLSLMILLSIVSSIALCQDLRVNCEQLVEMRSYSLCLPSSWHYTRSEHLDRVSACNKDFEHCTGNGGGFPLPGAVFVVIAPADRLPGNDKDLTGLVARAKTNAGANNYVISELDLGNAKRCIVVRSHLSPTMILNDIYGLQIDSLLFRAWAQYDGSSAEQSKSYQKTIEDVLSSVSITTPKGQKRLQ